ncbi:MAG: TIGR03936 family radical SAM-associated protein [Anaerolineales bacterium]|nr:TIGR03936 family radical SAM-associated protein [Anaerolineales bacterium]
MKKQRYRIFFSKTEHMRFTGHLDLILTWERTFRRAGLPLAYSEGFSPRPVLNMAAPLPLGFTSTGEIGDFWLSDLITINQFQSDLELSLPPGLLIQEIREIEDIHGPKLPSLVIASSYIINLCDTYPDLSVKIMELINSSSLQRERKGKSYDLRPLIISLELDHHNPTVIQMDLSTLPGATGRPDEVLAALEITALRTRITRSKIFLDPNGN